MRKLKATTTGVLKTQSVRGDRWDDNVQRNLLSLAILHLYEGDDLVVFEEFRKRNLIDRRLRLEECCSGSYKPLNTPMQRQITAQFPHQKYVHLFVATERVGVPSHYIVLKRSGVGQKLWNVVSRRVTVVKNVGAMDRSGMLITWENEKLDDPDVISRKTPILIPIITGPNVKVIAQSIATDYETQRQLTHCAMVYMLLAPLGGTEDDPILRLRISKNYTITMAVVGADLQNYNDPWGFKIQKVSQTSAESGKLRCTIHSDATYGKDIRDYIAIKPYTILPTIKEAYIERRMINDEDYNTYGLVRDILMSRLLPFIAVTWDEKYADIFALSYNRDKKITEVVKLKTTVKRWSPCEKAYPGIIVPDSDRGIYRTNVVMENKIADLLIHDISPDSNQVEARLRGLGRVFREFGYIIGTKKDIDYGVKKGFGIMLLAREDDRLQERIKEMGVN